MRIKYLGLVEVSADHEVEDEDFRVALAAYEPRVARPARGRLQVHMRVLANSLPEACARAVAVARAATGGEPLSVHVVEQRAAQDALEGERLEALR